MPSRTVFAVDPGPETSAAAVIHSGGKLEPWYGTNGVFLSSVDRLMFGADVVAIEMIASYGMPVGKDVFETCLFIGRLVQLISATREVRLVYRAEVKMHLCKSMKAKDGNIRQALIDKFGPPGTKKNKGATYGFVADAWAALGVAVTAMETAAPPENLRR